MSSQQNLQPGRNEPCPCGSGKKYKHCCLKRDKEIETDRRAAPVEVPGIFQVALEHQRAGRLHEAEPLYRQILQIEPSHMDALHLLGLIAHLQDNNDLAVELIGKALLQKPDFAEAHNNIGNALQAQGKLSAAIQSYLEAIAIKPAYTNAHFNLGMAYYRQGISVKAVNSFNKAISLKPDYAEAHYNLGIVHQNQGKLNAAIEEFQQAIFYNPGFANAHNNLGTSLQQLGKLDSAIEHYNQALSLNPNFVEAQSNLGSAFKDLGFIDLAITSLQKALAMDSTYTEAHSNLLNTMIFHPDLSREELYVSALAYETQRGSPLRPFWFTHHPDRDPHRRLRVGYFSPDFRQHAVTQFAEPLFSNHDKSQFEIFCYAEVNREDEITARFRQYADHWHSTVGMSDEAAAQMIYQHGIDILVDLAGHTAHNRLLVFARKPAPIQLTYLGYPGTTGLSAMDYRLTDYHTDPEGIADAYYTERLLRMPGSLWCYRPCITMPLPSPLPALARGFLTFGSFNNFNKIDQPTVILWAELLNALPTARLLILTVPEGVARQNLLARFKELGIDETRLELHGKLAPAEFHRKFLEVDITLDPVNVNGATTTCESLWMGVPVLSLTGQKFLARAGLSLLSAAGLSDFAAASPEELIRTACHLADNLPLLAEIRAGLREHLASTSLIDEIGFTRHLENLYREIWQLYCHRNSASLEVADNI